MRSLLLITFSLLAFFSCKETKKSTYVNYAGVCLEFGVSDTFFSLNNHKIFTGISVESGVSDTLQVWIGDSGIIVPTLFGPDTLSIKGPDGSTLTQVKFGPVYDQKISEGDTLEYGGAIIDFSNRDAVIGYVIAGKMQKDTLINFNPETKKEEISVVESLKTDTISTCTFTKGGGK